MIAQGVPNLAKRDLRNLQTMRASLVGSAFASTHFDKLVGILVDGGPKESSIKDLFSDEVSTMMSLRGSIVMVGRYVLSSFSVNNIEIKLLEEQNPPEQSRVGILFGKEILEGGMIRMHYAFVHDEIVMVLYLNGSLDFIRVEKEDDKVKEYQNGDGEKDSISALEFLATISSGGRGDEFSYNNLLVKEYQEKDKNQNKTGPNQEKKGKRGEARKSQKQSQSGVRGGGSEEEWRKWSNKVGGKYGYGEQCLFKSWEGERLRKNTTQSTPISNINDLIDEIIPCSDFSSRNVPALSVKRPCF
nr:hypothetical protein [Tanacetum cinerariifolium]